MQSNIRNKKLMSKNNKKSSCLLFKNNYNKKVLFNLRRGRASAKTLEKQRPLTKNHHKERLMADLNCKVLSSINPVHLLRKTAFLVKRSNKLVPYVSREGP